ncbi:MAG: hypothetical protein AAGN46_17160, partial [Acidobacteriota bacterium]
DPAADDGEPIEIDWAPLQQAINAFDDHDLDFEDNASLLYHVGALLGSLLAKLQREDGLDDAEVAETGAALAAFAVEVATGDEEVPPFEPDASFDPHDADGEAG